MKHFIILSALLLLFSFITCNNNPPKTSGSPQVFNLDTMKLKKGDSYYQCEMDTTIISNASGNCPICDMDLVEMKKN